MSVKIAKWLGLTAEQFRRHYSCWPNTDSAVANTNSKKNKKQSLGSQSIDFLTFVYFYVAMVIANVKGLSHTTSNNITSSIGKENPSSLLSENELLVQQVAKSA